MNVREDRMGGRASTEFLWGQRDDTPATTPNPFGAGLSSIPLARGCSHGPRAFC